MLTQLLSSKPKSKLINLLLAHPNRSFSLTELRMLTKTTNKLLARTVRELDKIGFLLVHQRNKHKFFQMNKYFALYPELVSVLRKVKNIPDDLLARKAKSVGDCRFIALTGVFAGKPRVETDILFVGRINSGRFKKFLQLAHKFAEEEVRYTVMTASEFEYRKAMNDRFVKNILENNPIVVLDKTKHRNIAKLVYRL